MSELNSKTIAVLNERFLSEPTEALLGWLWESLGARAAIGTSFQGAGLALIHMSRQRGFDFPIFTLDTGLWFPETIELHRRLEEFFGARIQALTPDQTVEQQARTHGPELWRRDPDRCCTLRKVFPLQAHLMDLGAWITGVRRQQSTTREQTALLELYTLEAASGQEILKANPLALWSREAVWEYIRRHGIPYNPLHDRGYRSIGCQPCTQPSGAEGQERAGRWTGFGKTECGIHTFMSRKA